MTDIVERLERQWATLDPVDEYRADARDAIEEITRFRAEVEKLNGYLETAKALDRIESTRRDRHGARPTGIPRSRMLV